MVPVPRFLRPDHDKRWDVKRRKTADDAVFVESSRSSPAPLGAEAGDGVLVTGDSDSNEVEVEDLGPIMPSFLNLSREEMDAKFDDLNWDERIRLTKGQPNNANYDWKWGMFKQPDIHERGMMDRYVNIKPWNHNRVKLHVPPGSLNYVNASSITVESPSDASRPPLRYIAMQGPTDPSLPYVWRMIAESVQGPVVIVQLTSNYEAGTVKCSQYFPDPRVPDASDGEPETEWVLNAENAWDDDWQAILKWEDTELLCNDAIERRKLTLQVRGEKDIRTIWHFWYRGWPDFGVPADEDLETFLELMRLSREHSSPKGPRIIHCSAGVGRTGTFIALEHLLRELDVGALCDPPSPPTTANGGKGKTAVKPEPKPDVIYNTVQDLRKQRKGMVQSEQQYRFLYNTLQKLWKERYEPEEDEDRAEGGVHLNSLRPTPSPSRTPNPASDPFAVPDNDDDEGGVKLQVPTRKHA